MLLKEALDVLKSGAQVMRRGWEVQDGYLVFMPGMKHIWKIVLQPQPNAGNYIFSMEDLASDDWELFSVPTNTCVEAPAAQEAA
jgi:hypothetical protein